jgi:hypothetical protein
VRHADGQSPDFHFQLEISKEAPQETMQIAVLAFIEARPGRTLSSAGMCAIQP